MLETKRPSRIARITSTFATSHIWKLTQPLVQARISASLAHNVASTDGAVSTAVRLASSPLTRSGTSTLISSRIC
jgi:hypothetical protein